MPSIYTDELFNEVCGLVAIGKTIREISETLGVSVGVIMKWAAKEANSEQYTRAREAASDIFESHIIDAAMATTPEKAAADRVKIDALKWVAARRSPKKYGDSSTVKVGGDGTPIKIQNVTDLSDEQLLAIANGQSE